jgi:hypothetical protein
MILVRDIFQLKFGRSREVREVWEQAKPIIAGVGPASHRTLLDFTGPYYTFVLESTHASLAAYEQHLQGVLGNAAWKQWYARLVPLVDSGRREIFTVLE